MLCLASTRATSQAEELFTKLELDLPGDELAAVPPGLRMDIPCLNAPPEGRSTRFDRRETVRQAREAADLYESSFRREATANAPEAYYPAVNAATVRLLAGDHEPAAKLARERLPGSMPSPKDKAITSWSARPRPISCSASSAGPAS